MKYCLVVFLAGLAAASANIKSLTEHDWTQIKSPMKEFPVAENSDLSFGLSGRIVGGSEATTNQFPHQAALIINTDEGQFFCGGSIISTSIILTAAHCIYE